MTRHDLLGKFQTLTDAELKIVWEFAEGQIKQRGYRTRDAYVERCVRDQLEAKPQSRWPDWCELAVWLGRQQVFTLGYAFGVQLRSPSTHRRRNPKKKEINPGHDGCGASRFLVWEGPYT